MTAVNLNRAVRGPVTAVPIVAGKGVKLTADVENNRWLVEADETVLWSGDFKYGDAAVTLSETIANFERILLVSGNTYMIHYRKAADGSFTLINALPAGDTKQRVAYATFSISGASVSYLSNRVMKGDTAYPNVSDGETHIIQIVGINRIAST